MAKYSDIKGFTVQTLSTDTIANQAAGGSWASGGDMNTARRALASAGIQTAAITFGGYTTTQVALNEQYNGSSWTEVGDLNAARHGIRGVGIYTAALAVGGLNPNASALNEIWDGSSWTEVGDLNTARGNFAGASGNGTTTAAIVFGGYTSGPGATGTVAINESWDGSSWTEVGDLNNVGSQGPSGVGTSTAAIRASSNTQPSGYAPVENWDGSSWTEGTNMNTNRGEDPGANGTQTDALVYGGFTTPPATTRANTEAWDGTSWTEVTDLSTARYAMTGCGTTGASSALAMGGYLTSNLASTEEWTAPATFSKITEGQLFFNSTANAFKETISDIPPTTWASGGALNQARSFADSAGTGTSSVLFGGSPGPTQAYTEQYDGSSWTEVSDLNTGRSAGASGGASGTDAVKAGGYKLPNVGNSLDTEIWNGSSWTEVNNLNSQKYVAGRGITISTSGIGFGGSNGSITANAEVWDGTNWTEVNNLNTARYYLGGFGSATSAIASNGINPGASPSYTQNRIEKWDGTSWTEIAELNTARSEIHGGSGVDNTLGFITGGSTTGSNQIANVELWNGSSWSEVNDLSTATRMAAVNGPSTSALHSGGTTSGNPVVTTTEEWTAPLANKTITAS
jgi:hypothetical protein